MKKSSLTRKKKRKEMSASERLSQFQRGLYRKAKQGPGFRFYALYDKLQIGYVLRCAWRQVKKNGGACGVDGVSIGYLSENGRYRQMLATLKEELGRGTYRPQAVKRVYIPKADGRQRPLGIPTVRDRVVQTACKLVLEPVFEADFEESSYGFRPGRSSRGAMKQIKKELCRGRTVVLDADLSSYFDRIPHTKLLKTIALRVSDGRMLRLVKLMLKAPIEEEGQEKGGKKNKLGTPQGGALSPLLANIYLHLLDRIVNKAGGIFVRHGIKIIRYADDFLLMGEAIPAAAMEKLQGLLGRMGLQLNGKKTKVVEAKEESFDFLGFTVRYDKDRWGRPGRYWNIAPSKKAEKKLRSNIKAYLHKHGHQSAESIVPQLNSKIRGWVNYFTIKGVSYPAQSKRRLRYYLANRLYRYYNRKSQRRSRLYGRRAYEVLLGHGLVDPTKYSPKATAKA